MQNMIQSRDVGSVILRVLKWVLLIALAIYTIFPLLWLFVTALKTNAEYFQSPFSFPKTPQWHNFADAFVSAGMGRQIINSIVVAFGAVIINLLLSGMAAYAISRYRFRAREAIFMAISLGVMIPLNAFMIPYYRMYSTLHLLDSHIGLILLYASINLPMSIFIIRGFMDTFPTELEEAANIDGLGFFGRFFHMVLPLTKNGFVTAGTFAFITCWNEFVYANLMLNTAAKRTIQTGVRWFTNEFTTDYVRLYAAICVAIAPSLAIYFLFQEQVISGLTVGAVKG
ncbi:MAG: carbohydrate ABC transporter permease [Oscillospiraceae bacterium]|nr:carbohydrate ABC transporter permease [Oscillospiraceae bacterium]